MEVVAGNHPLRHVPQGAVRSTFEEERTPCPDPRLLVGGFFTRSDVGARLRVCSGQRRGRTAFFCIDLSFRNDSSYEKLTIQTGICVYPSPHPEEETPQTKRRENYGGSTVRGGAVRTTVVPPKWSRTIARGYMVPDGGRWCLVQATRLHLSGHDPLTVHEPEMVHRLSFYYTTLTVLPLVHDPLF